MIWQCLIAPAVLIICAAACGVIIAHTLRQNAKRWEQNEKRKDQLPDRW